MKIRSFTRSVSALAFATITLGSLAQAANDVSYNPATSVSVSGVITSVREVPAGQPLEGLHVTLKNKAESCDVYVGPKEFLKFLKTSFSTGEVIDVAGSRVKNGAADVILAREVSDGVATLTLRDVYGHEAWKNWGVEVDPTTLH
jgi:hypothetical protein